MNLEDVKTLRLLVAQLDERIDGVRDLEAPEAANILLEFNIAKGELALVYDGLVNVLAHIMINDPILELRDGAQIERKVAYNRKGWQHKELANAVMGRIEQSSVDLTTGEVVLSPTDMAMKMLDYLAPSYWRVGKLNEIGLNADFYCEPSEPKTSVIVRKGEAQ